ncbi:MAG: hypothetical protein IPP74_07745 [Alphaproteobacteria bacterium]|nr:hypothetical protein [Alphaproteobacteria bacterium]
MPTLATRHERAASSLHQFTSVFGDFAVTQYGSLIGGIILEGHDPDGLNDVEMTILSLAARQIYQYLPESVVVTQYYIHAPGAATLVRQRSHPISELLSTRRKAFLDNKSLSGTFLIHLIEILPNRRLDKLSPLELLKISAHSFVSTKERDLLKHLLSPHKKVVIDQDKLEQQFTILYTLIRQMTEKWKALCPARSMSLGELWHYCKFLSCLDPFVLLRSLPVYPPVKNWDMLLGQTGCYTTRIGGVDCLKLDSNRPQYARLASVIQFGSDRITPGMWASTQESLVRSGKHFVIMLRFQPLSGLRKSLLFKSHENQILRKNISVLSLLQSQQPSNAPNPHTLKPVLKERLEELNRAEDTPDNWGMAHAMVAVFDKDPYALNENSIEIKKKMDTSGMFTCWESVNLIDAWKCFLPGGLDSATRLIPVTTSQFGALTLQYRELEGQIEVNDLTNAQHQKEEAQYIFLTHNNTPFHYSPFIGGRSMVFGVGPIRSGKSFTKNTLATHFLKYGGMFRAIDIDPGTEPIAQLYGDEGGIFKIDYEARQGFNLFASMESKYDLKFAAHIKQMIMEMIKLNDSEDLQIIDAQEQAHLDRAVRALMFLPKEHQTLSTLIFHTCPSLRQKMARWIRGTNGEPDGSFSHTFDCVEDAIGSLIKPVAVFNLANVKDIKPLFPLVMLEIFYRITGLFENPFHRHLPKLLDVDEAHAFLKVDFIRDYIVRSVRTWGKWNGGINLWTQSPKEFLDVPDWPALRSAATTFFFMADPQLDPGLYQETFHISEGECEAIKSLIPKREAYIVQREIGISKKIILEVEPEQYVVSTSTPYEVMMRQKNIHEWGVEEGIKRTVDALNNRHLSITHKGEKQ